MRTSDPEALAELARFAEDHPPLLRGGSTWGWVRPAARSRRALADAPLERIRARVVVVTGESDRTVDLGAHARIAALRAATRAPPATTRSSPPQAQGGTVAALEAAAGVGRDPVPL